MPRSVVFPEPEWPMIATYSPSRTTRSMPLRDDHADADVHPRLQAGGLGQTDADRERDDSAVVGSGERDEQHLAAERLAAERVDADDCVHVVLHLSDVELAELDVHGQVVE